MTSVYDHVCKPGVQSQMIAKKTSAAYSKAINDETLKKILKVIESGPQTAAGICNLLRPWIPDNVEISAADIHNIRLRCLALRVKGVKLASDEDKHNLVTFKGLEDEEIIELGTLNHFLMQTHHCFHLSLKTSWNSMSMML
jgi:hypothetical protein